MTAPRGPDLDLQIGIVALLNASADLKALIGSTPRIYQDVPASPTFPYVTLGEGSVADASVENFHPSDTFADIHVWSRASGFTEAKSIATAVYSALHEKQDALTLSEYHCTALMFERQTNMRDPDGVTKHITVSFSAHLAPKS